MRIIRLRQRYEVVEEKVCYVFLIVISNLNKGKVCFYSYLSIDTEKCYYRFPVSFAFYRTTHTKDRGRSSQYDNSSQGKGHCELKDCLLYTSPSPRDS